MDLQEIFKSSKYRFYSNYQCLIQLKVPTIMHEKFLHACLTKSCQLTLTTCG